MSFEIREKDLLARIGKLKTKTGTIETPLLFPVVNPALQPISPRKLREEFGFDALITNAYILKKRFRNQVEEAGLHKFLGYDGVVMTDSGAYQILVYGDVEVGPEEIVKYQEEIGSDIATILDIPTGWRISEKKAENTVRETLKRAKDLFQLKTREDILWVGPIQGGQYLNLVAESAVKMAKMPFQVYALGSPTEVMERYRFDVLVDMIMTAKANLPIERPLHLFGAGHPIMFSLAVALGCDLFDSAAYTIFAKENRYMTESATYRLEEMEYFQCPCPKCRRTTPERILELLQQERQIFLAEHNLYVCSAELKRVKQAIKDGRLWEHMEMRAYSHPALLQALKKLKKYQGYIERHNPATKKSGLFFFGSNGLMRPEILHHSRKLAEGYTKPKRAEILLLIPQPQTKPFHRSEEFRQINKKINQIFKEHNSKLHPCFYVAPFGIVPIELDEIYPLSQYENVLPLERENLEYMANRTADYITHEKYKKTIFLTTNDDDRIIMNAAKKTCQKRGITFRSLRFNRKPQKTVLTQFGKILREMLSE